MKNRRANDKLGEAVGSDGGGVDDRQLRARLVQAAVRLFTLYGYQSVTVAQIGAAANVTGPALYRHFPSKDALLSAALFESGERTLQDAKRILTEVSPPATALERLVETWAREAIVEKSRMLFGYFHENKHLSAVDRKQMDDRYATFVAFVADALSAVAPQLREDECTLRVQAAMGMIASSPYFVSDLHESALTKRLVNLSLEILV